MRSNVFFKDTDELIYKAETDLQIFRTDLGLSKGKHGKREKSGAWD